MDKRRYKKWISIFSQVIGCIPSPETLEKLIKHWSTLFTKEEEKEATPKVEKEEPKKPIKNMAGHDFIVNFEIEVKLKLLGNQRCHKRII